MLGRILGLSEPPPTALGATPPPERASMRADSDEIRVDAGVATSASRRARSMAGDPRSPPPALENARARRIGLLELAAGVVARTAGAYGQSDVDPKRGCAVSGGSLDRFGLWVRIEIDRPAAELSELIPAPARDLAVDERGARRGGRRRERYCFPRDLRHL